jgi:5-methylcytosine-specific restriction enzyme A
MPITRGSGNPKWTKEETILALDLLYRHGRPLDRGHPDVVELSHLLRSADIIPLERHSETFRNPDGVALKMQNLLSAIDPSRGLSSSALDRATVEEMPRQKAAEVAALASAIRIALQNPFPPPDLDQDEDEFFIEGKLLSTRHRQRERRLRKRLLLQRGNPLVCDICDFSPPGHERALQESFFEAHHTVPLATAEGLRKTSIADMALLCANCHRFAHRLFVLRGGWLDVPEVRAEWVTLKGKATKADGEYGADGVTSRRSESPASEMQK